MKYNPISGGNVHLWEFGSPLHPRGLDHVDEEHLVISRKQTAFSDQRTAISYYLSTLWSVKWLRFRSARLRSVRKVLFHLLRWQLLHLDP